MSIGDRARATSARASGTLICEAVGRNRFIAPFLPRAGRPHRRKLAFETAQSSDCALRPWAARTLSVVTQAFNTTTSMGRLTLNVLLSFDQFEREVTGGVAERN
jgi:hypothetical protein